ncbi:TetR/AcrR family transcriptional regulator [Gibbsiella quercinecans]|nr:TetR/AcrR family transcriptional regulator [Gibbsiella quercinecans]
MIKAILIITVRGGFSLLSSLCQKNVSGFRVSLHSATTEESMRKGSDILREHIITEAAAILQSQGYEALTFRLLASRLGCVERALLNHFAHPEELLTAVIRTYATRHLTQAVSVISDTQSYPLRTMLTRFGVRMLLVLQDDRDALDIYRRVLSDAACTNIGLLFYEAGFRDALEKLTQALDIAMVRREIRLGDPRIMAQQLLSLFFAVGEIRLLEREPEPINLCQIRKMVREAVHVFLYGAAVRPDATRGRAKGGE